MFNIFKIFILLFFTVSCKQSLQQKEMERLLNSLNMNYGSYYNASETSGVTQLPTSKPDSNHGIEIVDGVPSQNQKGYCGDGIINGDNEHCDRNAISFTECAELQGGLHGKLKCTQDCHFDISDCMTQASDTMLGGRGETCKCNCDPSLCQGACAGAGGTGESTCFFNCARKNCTCQCEDLFEYALNSGNIQCRCVTDASGAPNCACSLDQIEGVVLTKPNYTLNAIRLLGK